jgi:hypothetical protein
MTPRPRSSPNAIIERTSIAWSSILAVHAGEGRENRAPERTGLTCAPSYLDSRSGVAL